MKNVEIERKFLIKKEALPLLDGLKCSKIAQAFIYLRPCIRIRQADDRYYLTIKSEPPKALKNAKTDLARAEYEIEISKKVFTDLSKLCKGKVIYKTRYFMPCGKHTIEIDIFEKDFKGLIYAEVEFKSLKEAEKFKVPSWFYKDVTGIEKYKNTNLSICKNIKSLLKY